MTIEARAIPGAVARLRGAASLGTPPTVLATILWPLAIGSFMYRCVLLPLFGPAIDMEPEWHAVVAFLHHQAPYAPQWVFIYPPSAITLYLPFGFLSLAHAKLAFLVLDLAAVLIGTVLALKIFDLSWRSAAGALSLFGLTLAWPVFSTLSLDQANGIMYLAETGALLSIVRRRWMLAAILLGLSLSVKPVLAPLLLLLLFNRRAREAAVAVAIPLILSIPPLLLNHDTVEFFTRIVPLLLNGNYAQVYSYNVSLAGMVPILHLPSALVLVLRGAVLIVTGLLVALRWRRGGDEPLRIVETSALILLGAFLCFSYSERHFGIYLIPLLISVIRPGAMMRYALAWVGVYFIFTLDVWTSRRLGDFQNRLLSMLPTAGYLLILATALLQLSRQRLPTLATSNRTLRRLD